MMVINEIGGLEKTQPTQQYLHGYDGVFQISRSPESNAW